MLQLFRQLSAGNFFRKKVSSNVKNRRFSSTTENCKAIYRRNVGFVSLIPQTNAQLTKTAQSGGELLQNGQEPKAMFSLF